MKTNLTTVSYTLATVASICFISGMLILTGEMRLPNGQA